MNMETCGKEDRILNAMIIDEKDNVAVAIEQIVAGEQVTYLKEGTKISLTAVEPIQIYHKIAIEEIAKGTPVVKYGEHIGRAKEAIAKGAHVHVHNIEGFRENLEEKE